VPQVVLIIQAQFFEAGAGHVRELQFHLLRGAAGLAALGDVLHSAARGLHHLIMGADAVTRLGLPPVQGILNSRYRA